MSALYSVAEVLAATKGQARNVEATDIHGVSIDSREIAPGDLFVAIRGDRFDGHDFVADAIKGGASAALISESRSGDYGDLPLIVVPDALEGLTALARAARARSEALIVAVTGSAGKTTTKEAIRAVCEAAGKTHASIRSFNNHWGVPLMLARMPADTQFGVFEIGMSAPGEIGPLSRLVRPDIAVITSIAPAHMENFDSLAGIARAKAEIFEGLEPHGWAILNADHGETAVLRDAARAAGIAKVMTYGYGEDADVRIGEPDADFAGGTRARVTSALFNATIRIASAGRHRLANAVAALLTALVAGIAEDIALDVLATLEEPEGRGAVLRLGAGERRLIIIDESYNANPASMAAALEVFAGLNADPARKVLVLADMLELGTQAADLHRSLADIVSSIGTKRIFLIGEQMEHLARALGPGNYLAYAATVDELMDDILNSLDYGDAVMIKGSNSMRLGGLVSRMRDRFGAADTV